MTLPHDWELLATTENGGIFIRDRATGDVRFFMSEADAEEARSISSSTTSPDQNEPVADFARHLETEPTLSLDGLGEREFEMVFLENLWGDLQFREDFLVELTDSLGWEPFWAETSEFDNCRDGISLGLRNSDSDCDRIRLIAIKFLVTSKRPPRRPRRYPRGSLIRYDGQSISSVLVCPNWYEHQDEFDHTIGAEHLLTRLEQSSINATSPFRSQIISSLRDSLEAAGERYAVVNELREAFFRLAPPELGAVLPEKSLRLGVVRYEPIPDVVLIHQLEMGVIRVRTFDPAETVALQSTLEQSLERGDFLSTPRPFAFGVRVPRILENLTSDWQEENYARCLRTLGMIVQGLQAVTGRTSESQLR